MLGFVVKRLSKIPLPAIRHDVEHFEQDYSGRMRCVCGCSRCNREGFCTCNGCDTQSCGLHRVP